MSDDVTPIPSGTDFVAWAAQVSPEGWADFRGVEGLDAIAARVIRDTPDGLLGPGWEAKGPAYWVGPVVEHLAPFFANLTASEAQAARYHYLDLLAWGWFADRGVDYDYNFFRERIFRFRGQWDLPMLGAEYSDCTTDAALEAWFRARGLVVRVKTEAAWREWGGSLHGDLRASASGEKTRKKALLTMATSHSMWRDWWKQHLDARGFTPARIGEVDRAAVRQGSGPQPLVVPFDQFPGLSTALRNALLG